MRVIAKTRRFYTCFYTFGKINNNSQLFVNKNLMQNLARFYSEFFELVILECSQNPSNFLSKIIIGNPNYFYGFLKYHKGFSLKIKNQSPSKRCKPLKIDKSVWQKQRQNKNSKIHNTYPRKMKPGIVIS